LIDPPRGPFCPNCGVELPSAARFCPACGTEQPVGPVDIPAPPGKDSSSYAGSGWGTPTAAAAESSAQEHEDIGRPATSGGGRLALRAAALAVVAVIVAAGIYQYSRTGDQVGQAIDSSVSQLTVPTPAPVNVQPAPAQAGGERLCSTLSNDQISQIMGRAPLSFPSGSYIGGLDTCVWLLWMSPAEAVTVQLADSQEGWFGDSGQPIQGLGYPAAWIPEAKELQVKVGSRLLTVGAVGGTTDPEAAAISFAQIVIPQIA
jgi:hypothetical protein